MIWLHGLGADGNDFAPMTAAFARADAPLRFIFPHAPHRAVGVNGGAVMRAWYDIANVDLSRDQDRAGLDESTQLVHALIARLDVKSENIILGGFSQGGALALHAGLRFAEPLGAVIALSAYLPLADSFAAERNAANQSTPISSPTAKPTRSCRLHWRCAAHNNCARWNTRSLGALIRTTTASHPRRLTKCAILFSPRWIKRGIESRMYC